MSVEALTTVSGADGFVVPMPTPIFVTAINCEPPYKVTPPPAILIPILVFIIPIDIDGKPVTIKSEGCVKGIKYPAPVLYGYITTEFPPEDIRTAVPPV